MELNPPADDEPFVLGSEYAAALDAEADHRSRVQGVSPLAGIAYDRWLGHHDLFRFVACDVDDSVRVVIEAFCMCTDPSRRSRRDRLTLSDFYTLLAFARRAAVIGARSGDAQYPVAALNAIAMMDAARVDYRDIVWALGLVTDVVRELGDSRHAVNAAIHMSMEPVAEMLRRFADPVDEDADLASWGYMRVETPEGIGFIGRGIEPFEPSLDMVAVAGRIAGAVDRDTYRVKSIEAATDLATVWLPGAPPRAVDGVLERCRGVVTINAELLPEHPNSDHQQFTAFLVEAATSADATSLCEWSTGISSIGHVSVAVQRDALLCLVVARSVVQGVDAHESAVAISRFEEPLSRALAGPV